jgi:hypothetical protein
MALAPPSVGDYRRMKKALTEAIARAERADAALATERMALREFAKAALFRTMSDLSETCWCAGWMDGTEYALWDAVEKNQPVWWGMEEVRQRDIDDLRRLRELSGGWWIWDDEHYETFVSIDEMRRMAEARQSARG